MCRFPQQRFSVICLSNLNSVNPSYIAHQISHIYLAQDYTKTKKISLQSDREFTERSTTELESKTGFYRNVKSGAIWELAMQGEKLMVDAAGFSFQLVPGEQDRYHSVETFYDFNIKFEQPDSLAFTMSFWVEDGKPTILERFEPYALNRDCLADYVGEYFCQELGIKYQLSLEDRQLKICRQNLSTAHLKQISLNLFKEADNCLDFIFSDRNRVKGFNLNAGGGHVRSIHFIKQRSRL